MLLLDDTFNIYSQNDNFYCSIKKNQMSIMLMAFGKTDHYCLFSFLFFEKQQIIIIKSPSYQILINWIRNKISNKSIIDTSNFNHVQLIIYATNPFIPLRHYTYMEKVFILFYFFKSNITSN